MRNLNSTCRPIIRPLASIIRSKWPDGRGVPGVAWSGDNEARRGHRASMPCAERRNGVASGVVTK
jgi:hypothetical protein